MEKTAKEFQPAQLRLARLFHGLSQPELGERINSSRQYVHQLEAGIKMPNELMIAVLAEQLQVQPIFFFQKISDGIEIEQCHFRKQRTTPISVTQQVLARGSLFGQLVDLLDEHLELPVVNFPDMQASTKEEIERVAEKCRKYWGLGLTAPITNMTRVAENAGAVITHFLGVSEKVDALSMNRRRPIIVMSTAKGSPCRSRFDIAHEIGHLIMHQGIETGDHETESQANQFASAFLLPRSALAAEFPRGSYLDWQAIYRIKLKYKVSAAAILYRAHHDLRLIDASQYRRAQIHLTKTGQRKNELYDEDISTEMPELLGSALNALRDEEGIGAKEIINTVNISFDFLQKLTGIDLQDKHDQNELIGNIIKFPGT